MSSRRHDRADRLASRASLRRLAVVDDVERRTRAASAAPPDGLAASPRMVAQRERIGQAFGAPIQGKWKEILGMGGLVLGGVGALALAPAAVAGVVATGLTAAVLGAGGYMVGRRLDEAEQPAERGRDEHVEPTEPIGTNKPATTGVTPDSSLLGKSSVDTGGTKDTGQGGPVTPLAPRKPVKLDASQVVLFVELVEPKKFTSLGKFMMAAKAYFLTENGTTEADWNNNRGAIELRAARYFVVEDEESKEEAETKVSSVVTARAYDFADNSTWTMQAIHSPNGTGWQAVNVGAHDAFYLTELRAGRLTNNSTARSPAVGVNYHAHMVNNGGGGIAFYYEHTGGGNVRPVIYDWATRRTGNNYHWVQARTTSNTAP